MVASPVRTTSTAVIVPIASNALSIVPSVASNFKHVVLVPP